MLLTDIKEWIKTLGIGEKFYAGKLSDKHEKSIGIYSRQSGQIQTIPIGGFACKGYDVKRISILVHWTKNARETEEAALDLFSAIQINGIGAQIGESRVDFIQMMMEEPEDVGTDNSGVYERVIWCDIYYER